MSEQNNHWPSGARDTTEFPKVSISFDTSLREHLEAFCKMDGVGWTDYNAQNEASGLTTSGSRLRTYRKMYEKFGLIYRDNDILRLSRLGKQMKSLTGNLEKKKEEVLNQLRTTAIDILSRYQLKNPQEKEQLPDDCDVLPCIVIWKTMITLDGKMHPEEINRVLLRVMRMADLDEAICIIREARIKYGNYSGLSADALDDILGLPVHADQVPARIAPWFSFAGWGGLIIEQNVDSEGFRNLTLEAVPLVEKILENPPTYYATEDEDDWLTYYIGSAIETEENTEETVAVINAESGDTVAADVRVFEEIPDDLTIDQLGCILAEMYSKAAGNQQVVAIHMFGLKYGKVIIEKGYTAASITRASKINDSYATEVSKGINMYKALSQNKHGMMITYGKCDEQNQVIAIPHKKKALPIRSGRTKTSFSMNSILYGAPGTGKTFSTAEYAIAMVEKKSLDEVRTAYPDRAGLMSKYAEYIEKERVVFTTFHQSYSYEDFVQGLRPDSDSDKLSLIPYDGVLKRIADRAMQDQENDYVIIIDEINRANISKVFGELITLIEEDKRWGELNALSVTLPSGDHFAVPNNLFILGTMNTADKSISLIDTALRRRFEFVEMTPDADKIADPVLKDVFTKLNTGLAKELDGTDLLIGHAYFIGKTVADLCQIMNRSIIPLLYEYFYDSGKKVENQLKNALTGLDVEVTRNPFGRIKLTPKEQ